MTAADGRTESSPDPNAPSPFTSFQAGLWRDFVETRANALREALFEHYMPYARSVAAQLYAGRHRDDVEFNDFRQLALVGLLEAIDRFDPGCAVTFETFCTARIRGTVLDGVQKLTDGQEQISFMRRARRDRLASLRSGEASGDTCGNPVPAATFDDLAQLTAGLAISYMLEDTGLFAQDGDAPSTRPSPWQSIAWRQTVEQLRGAVRQLDERDYKIIHYHYFNGMRFEQIADILGVSKARVSQLHRAALGRLRERLGNQRQLYTKG
jgi:RNA polymerase sigma factor FliA